MKRKLDSIKLPAGTEFMMLVYTVLFPTGIAFTIPTKVQKAIVLRGGTTQFRLITYGVIIMTFDFGDRMAQS